MCEEETKAENAAENKEHQDDTPCIYGVNVSNYYISSLRTYTDISRGKQSQQSVLEPGLWQSQYELSAKPSEDGVLILWQIS